MFSDELFLTDKECKRQVTNSLSYIPSLFGLIFQDSLTLIDRNKTGEYPPQDLVFEEWGRPLGSTNSLAPSPHVGGGRSKKAGKSTKGKTDKVIESQVTNTGLMHSLNTFLPPLLQFAVFQNGTTNCSLTGIY